MKKFLTHIIQKMNNSGIYKILISKIRYTLNKMLNNFQKFPTYGFRYQKELISTEDPIRYTSVGLAIQTIKRDGIRGSFAEVGVYKGHTSRIIHLLAPKKKLFLFDTFEGFPKTQRDDSDERFQDTTTSILKKNIGDLENIVIRKGIFPISSKGLENENFAFVMIDLDKYEPTLKALSYFYPKIQSGGYIFIHDYNNPQESNGAVNKAVINFCENIPEKLIEIPDKWGTVIIRKN